MRRRLVLVLLLLPALAPIAPTGRAQPTAASRQAVIDEVYAAMFAALEAGTFARARNLCDQVILWEPANPVHHYNLACIEARAGTARLDAAVAALTKAVDLGFIDATHVRGDADLAALHRDPRFIALLARMDAARAALPPGPAANQAPTVITLSATPPRGLFLATPAGLPSGTLPPERSVWFFDDDGTVALDPIHGVATPDHNPEGRARRANVTLEGDVLSLAWPDGARLAGKLTGAASGFTWQGWQFLPASPPPPPAQLAGRYTRGAAYSLRANVPDAPTEVTLASDGRAEWLAADRSTIAGRWEWSRHTLALVAAPATAGSSPPPAAHFLCFVFRGEAEASAPPLLYVGGFVYERQP